MPDLPRPLRFPLWMAAILLAGASGATQAEDPDGAALLEGVQKWLDGTRDLRGRFEQSLLSSAMGADLTERGEIYIERPGRMRWDYQEPERKVAIVDGDRTLFYLEEDSQLTHGRLDGETDLLPNLLAGDARLGDSFRAERIELTGVEGRKIHGLRLVPHDSEQGFAEVVLLLRAPHFSIEAAEVLDPAGNRILYRFPTLRRNRGLPEGLFVFEPPPGTDVVGQP